MKTGINENINANITVDAYFPKNVILNMMAIVAPKHAPDEMPVVKGSAKWFFMIVCIMQPAKDKPIPASIATKTRGALRFHITLKSKVSLSTPITP